VKAILLILLLSGFGLWAQVSNVPPLPSAPVTPAGNANSNTNLLEARRQARRRAMMGLTNAPIPFIATNRVPPAVSPASPVVKSNLPPPAPPPGAPQADRPGPSGNLPPPGAPPPGAPPGAAPPGAGPPGPTQIVTVAPKAAVTNAPAPGDEPIPEGMIDFRGADLNQVLEIYSMLVNRTILRPATLPAPTIVLKTQGRLTVREGIQALDAVVGLNGISMV